MKRDIPKKEADLINHRIPDVGNVVIFCDPHGKDHNAIVTAVWCTEFAKNTTEANNPVGLNLVMASDDASAQDQYGRQVHRETSISHASTQRAHGFYWRFPDEKPNPHTPPVS